MSYIMMALWLGPQDTGLWEELGVFQKLWLLS